MILQFLSRTTVTAKRMTLATEWLDHCPDNDNADRINSINAGDGGGDQALVSNLPFGTISTGSRLWVVDDQDNKEEKAV